MYPDGTFISNASLTTRPEKIEPNGWCWDTRSVAWPLPFKTIPVVALLSNVCSWRSNRLSLAGTGLAL
jgi:hypothetical protein